MATNFFESITGVLDAEIHENCYITLIFDKRYEKVLENSQGVDVQSVSDWYLCFCHMACHPI